MYSKTPTGKVSKGSVSILCSHDRLQLRFRYAGKRHYLSLGFADTPQNRKLAEMKAREIELDILAGHFDQTLEKYKPQSALKVVAPEEVTPKVTPTIQELWEQYTSYKASSVKETTRLYYVSFARLFEQLGGVTLMEPLRVKAELEKLTTIYQTKKTLMQLNAACKWAMKHGLIEGNPYEGMAGEMPKYRYQVGPKPNAFTEEERERVIQAFKDHQGNWNGRGYTGIRYSHYAPFVEFLFLTGCRPSEAIGLRWSNVAEDCESVRFAESITTSGRGKPIRVEGSKNNKKRIFPCSNRLKGLLLSIKPEKVEPSALVFPSPKSKPINYNNFYNNAWKRIVEPIKAG
ncbi:Arm DNA-binding domain-containing protein [Leptolyngbya sp. AN02str]|uniref:Arm DNA-binding domain-containing protein n=1 Tax=Leptolyngbya sp. AN02str TaxID=3423363 RepID=UPI003D319FB8